MARPWTHGTGKQSSSRGELKRAVLRLGESFFNRGLEIETD